MNNLMTVDTDNLLSFFWGINNLFINILMILGVLSMIYYKIGKAIVYGLYVFAGAFVFNIIVSSTIA
jgi:hypothetical protein